MRKAMVGAIAAMAMIFSVSSITHAAPLDDAKALAIKAAQFVEKNGAEKGIAEIGNPKGQFVKGDLYVVIQDTKGISRANPAFPAMNGVDSLNLKDPTGKLFIKEMIEIVTTKGSGWCSYTWTNPATKKVQLKKVWVQKVEGTDLYTLCGVFQ